MKLINKTKKQVISTKVIVREKIHEIVLGLIPYKNKNEYIYDYLKFKKFDKNDAMLFKVRGKSGIHTWFMSFPIAIFFLDKDWKVIEKVELRPFESYKPNQKCESFIELDDFWFGKISIGNELKITTTPVKNINL